MNPLRKIRSDQCIGNEKCLVAAKRSLSCVDFTTPPDKQALPTVDWIDQEMSVEPRSSVWTFTNREETESLTDMDHDEAKKFIRDKLTEAGVSGTDARVSCELLMEALAWAVCQGWDAPRVSALLGILLDTHRFFSTSPRRTYQQTYNFCRESILLHSIQDSAKAVRLLEAPESVKFLKYFCETYLTMLPLLRVFLKPNYRLEVVCDESEHPKSKKSISKI